VFQFVSKPKMTLYFSAKIDNMYKINCFLVLFISFVNVGFSQLRLEDIWKKSLYRPSFVSGFKSMNDGLHFSKENYKEDNSFINIGKYSFLKSSEQTASILSISDLTAFNKDLKGFDDYIFNTDESKLLLQLNTAPVYRRSFTADHLIVDLKTRAITTLDKDHAPQRLVSFSPDGQKVAYVFEENIFVKELNSGKITQLTKEVKGSNITCGHTDWVYEEEFAITKVFEWSSDSKSIAFLKFNSSKLPSYHLLFHKNELYPELYTYPYPKAGEVNSMVTLHIAQLGKKKHKQVVLGQYEYIPRMQWSSKENKLLVLTLNRWQNELNYHLIDPATSLTSKVIYTEKDAAYVEIDDNLLILNDGKHFLRCSEKDGYNHIYKIGFDGSSKQITTGNWDVIALKGINETDGIIYYTSAEEGAIYSSLYKVNIDGNGKDKLSSNKGQNDMDFSSGMKYYFNTFSNSTTPYVFTLHKSDGSLIETLEDNKMLFEKLRGLNLPKKEFTTVEGVEGSLNMSIIKPVNFDPSKKYPVYFNVYCGPGSNEVKDGYDGNDYLYHQLLAQNGYIVVQVDTRGTMYRGAKFKKSTYLQLGKLETEDLIEVAKNLGKLSYVDPARIGIMGWSYGGYMSSLCITKGADQFKMAIAVAPVTNWKWYDNIYTERFMRTPSENNAGYEDNSPINHVSKIKGKYLLVHGTGDDNVHDQNSMEMINALVKANITYDSEFYPNRNHGIGGGNTRFHLFSRLFNFTIQNL
jgi:dipeptidyl-peptidase 4